MRNLYMDFQYICIADGATRKNLTGWKWVNSVYLNDLTFCILISSGLRFEQVQLTRKLHYTRWHRQQGYTIHPHHARVKWSLPPVWSGWLIPTCIRPRNASTGSFMQWYPLKWVNDANAAWRAMKHSHSPMKHMFVSIIYWCCDTQKQR